MIGALTYLASAAELRPLYNGQSALTVTEAFLHCAKALRRARL
jgi:hypothetical protein